MSDEHPQPAAPHQFRVRLFAGCVLLLGLAMAQSPGLLVADTKLDLAVAPADFLLRAVHLWDAEGAFGQLQNQAYGYLWPMGPFFLLGAVVDLSGWVVQRFWVALVMCVAMVGAAKLARALGVRSDLAAITAGFAYALSPRMLTTLGPISVEAWPSALAPWVLLPLVVGSERGSPRRAAALSALAVAMVGGVNAAAAFAVIPLGALWLLSRTRGPRRRILMTWWPLFTLLGTLWWLVPLFYMGAYSPPFLDYIEAADNTTFPTTLFDALRGTSDWVPYVDTTWRAGNDLIRDSYLVVNSGVLLFIGVWGIARRDNPHRLFLALGVLMGLFAVTMGHLGAVQGWAAPALHELLDGPLAPLRNVHKFDPLIRLPLVLGLAWFLDDALARLREVSTTRADRQGPRLLALATPEALQRLNLSVLVGTTVLAVAGAATPAIGGRLAPSGGFDRLPGYWAEAADFLADQEDAGTALVLPGSSFGQYVWGFPRDEPLQSLAETPWAVRNAVPLTPAGNIRMLDAVERLLAQGLPSDGLAPYLRRAGVSHVVVRNDLAIGAGAPEPVRVHQALDESPGLDPVASFGPVVGGEGHLQGELGRILVNGGWQNEYPAIEVYEVDGDTPAAVTSEFLPVVVGGPEDLLDLADLAVLEDEPTILAADLEEAPAPDQPVILTDGLREVERNFGRVHDGTSATLVEGQQLRLENPAPDYLPPGGDEWTTTAVYDGIESVRASSSMSEADVYGAVQPGQLPFAALDALPRTAWVANTGSEPNWWQVDLTHPRSVGTVTILAGPRSREVLRVSTSSSTVEEVEIPAGTARTVDLSDDRAEWIRIEDVSGRDGHRMTLAEVQVDSLQPHRSLLLPTLPESWPNPDTVVLRRLLDARNGCVEIDNALRCVQGREVTGEEPLDFRRTFSMPSPGSYTTELRVQPRPGPALGELLLRNQPAGVAASTTGNRDPRASAIAAVDGDPGTTWTAALEDLRPTLSLNWLGERRVRGFQMDVPADTAARLPEELTLTWPGGSREVEVGRDGSVLLDDPIRTDRLTIQVREARPATSLGFDSIVSPVPIGIGELRVLGVPYFPLALPDEDRRLPCGSGPELVVSGRALETSVTAGLDDLYAGRTVEADLCGRSSIGLVEGVNRVDVEASELFVGMSLVLSDASSVPQVPEVLTAARDVDAPTERMVRVSGGEVLTERVNANPGWQARQAGEALDGVVVDGWQQGWRLVDDEAPVQVSYDPDTGYRVGLLVGLVTLVALAAFVVVRRRPSRDAARPALGAARLPAPVLAALAVVAGGLLAGWWGAGAAVGGFLVGALSGRDRGDGHGWLVALVVVPAALAYSVRPWGGADQWAGTLAWPHYLVVVSCAGLLGFVAVSAGWRPPTLRKRMAGISTSR